MRILHVISSLGVGGAETIAVELARLHAKDNHVAVLTLFSAGDGDQAVASARRKQLYDAGVVLHEACRTGRQEMILAALRVRKIVADWGPDLVHSHTDLPDFSVSLARRLVRFAICRTVHNTELWATRPRSARIVEAAIRDDLVIAINPSTESAYRALRSSTGQPVSSHIEIIPNGLPILEDQEYASSDEVHRLLKTKTGQIQLGFIGRLEAQKGVDLLLSAIALLPAPLLEQMQLHIIGDGTLKPEVVAAQARMPNNICFHGSLPSPRRLFRGFDGLLIPSRFEGMPLIGIEALLSGRPTVITDAVGLRDIFPSDWPWVVKAGDANALASVIADFIANPIAPAVTPNGRYHFSSDVMADRYSVAYRSYLIQRE